MKGTASLWGMWWCQGARSNDNSNNTAQQFTTAPSHEFTSQTRIAGRSRARARTVARGALRHAAWMFRRDQEAPRLRKRVTQRRRRPQTKVVCGGQRCTEATRLLRVVVKRGKAVRRARQNNSTTLAKDGTETRTQHRCRCWLRAFCLRSFSIVQVCDECLSPSFAHSVCLRFCVSVCSFSFASSVPNRCQICVRSRWAASLPLARSFLCSSFSRTGRRRTCRRRHPHRARDPASGPASRRACRAAPRPRPSPAQRRARRRRRRRPCPT